MPDTDGTKSIRIEYGEEYIEPDSELEVFAAERSDVQVLDATPVGDQIRLRYVVLWENGGRR